MNRIAALTSSALMTQYAIDTSQAAVRPIARFLAPLAPVPDTTFRYKTFSARSRYRRPVTRRAPGSPATQIGFTAGDTDGTLLANALDFPIPNTPGMSEATLQNYVRNGTSVLADAGGLSHEAEVVEVALASLGNGTDANFADNSLDPIDLLDETILEVAKAAKNGAPVKVLFGTTAFRRTRANAKVKSRFVSGARGGIIAPSLADISAMLMTNPEVQMSFMVIDNSAEGQDEDIDFILDDSIIVFASQDTPNQMDPSFMKTFVPMGNFFVPGSYLSTDERDQVLKMDWVSLVRATNPTAARRLNAKAA